jgi:outer membrane protein assembly factor BamB
MALWLFLGSGNAFAASAVRSAAGEFTARDARVGQLGPRASQMSQSKAAAAIKMELGTPLGSGPGPDWNTGVGGQSDRSGRSSQIGPDAATLLWQEGQYNAPIGVPESSATQGNLLVSTRISAAGQPPERGWIVAQDLSSGEELWSTQLPISFESNWWSHSFGVRDGQVYASRSLGIARPDYLYALDASDGSVIWQSEDLIDADIVETPPFAENGDLIVGTWRSLLRVSQLDGSTVWSAPRTCPTQPGGCQATVSGKRAYIWDARLVEGGLALVVVAFDIDTGEELYASPPLLVSVATIQQIALFCDSTGAVYAPSARVTAEDALIGLEDTGSELIELWRTPIDWVPWASFGIGPDGSVYSYTPMHEVVQLDPKTGKALGTSMPIPFTNRLLPRLAVDAAGKLYLTAYYGAGWLFSFDPDLTLRWEELLPGAEGPALGEGGILAVTGTGTELRAYQVP